jgi:hypothetical protein
MTAIWIPVIAILATFAVPITAIIMDFRRRKLHSEERRAMIERGMQPPPAEEGWTGVRSEPRDLATRRERALQTGITMLFTGIGLAVGAVLLNSVIAFSFIPRGVAGPMAVGAAVVGCIGIGNLTYYFVTRAAKGATRD